MVKTTNSPNTRGRTVEIAPETRVVVLREEEYAALLRGETPEDLLAADAGVEGYEAQVSEEVRNRIAETRARQGVSQRELAQRMGVDPSTVSRWERDDANITLRTLGKIAAALGVRPPSLIG